MANEPSLRATVRALARDVYQFACPILLTDLTLQQVTAVPNATSVAGRAPINQFAYFREYPRADARDIVRFNFDTLYSTAWIDLSRGPIVLTVPDTAGRYYLVPTLDMWTDVFCSVGSRTTGTKAGQFAYVAPGWRGKLPPGVERIEAPTSVIWALGRIQTNGPSDYANVHALQDALRLAPLERWGEEYAPPAAVPVDPNADTSTPPFAQLRRLSGVESFTRLAELMKMYPPHASDYPILLRMRAIGLEVGKSWEPGKLERDELDAIDEGAREGLEEAIQAVKKLGVCVNGWNFLTDNVGTFGTSYRQRAAIAIGGVGANLPDDAVYPTAFLDGDGRPLDSTQRYVLHFKKGELPPANAFWSLTMYDLDGYQVVNPIQRFAIGDRDPLRFNADGSLDLYIQTDSPGKDKECNWLPAPRSGGMGPTLRIYSPRREALNGTWQPPPLRRVG